ncbi:MAG: AbrB/MazE/SpoVT family DNA-binding domain-containing protein [Pseudomonadota bacterium]
MPTKLNRWGNSLGLRLPQHVVEAAGLAAGDYLYVRLLDSCEIMIRAAKAGSVPAEYGI